MSLVAASDGPFPPIPQTFNCAHQLLLTVQSWQCLPTILSELLGSILWLIKSISIYLLCVTVLNFGTRRQKKAHFPFPCGVNWWSMLPASSLIMSMRMKLPFSRGWIKKTSLNRADKKPAWLPVMRRVMKATDGQGYVLLQRLALSGPRALLTSPFVTISRRQALLLNWGYRSARDSPSVGPDPRDQIVLTILTACSWWRRGRWGGSSPPNGVAASDARREVPDYLIAGEARK